MFLAAAALAWLNAMPVQAQTAEQANRTQAIEQAAPGPTLEPSTSSPARLIPRAEIGLGVTTLGLGPELGLRAPGTLLEKFGVRIALDAFSYGRNLTVSDISYRADAHLLSGSAKIDFYPFTTGFRISGGILAGNNSVKLKATPSNNLTLGNTTYTPAEIGTLQGTAKYPSSAPYLGFGYVLPVFSQRASLSFDAGAIHTGTANLMLAATGPMNNTTQGQADLAAQSNKVSNSLRATSWYPFLGITLSYRF